MTKRFRIKGNRKYLVFVVVLLILVSVFFINFCRGNSSSGDSDRKIKQNLATISTFDYSTVSTIEKELKNLEASEAKGTFDVTKKLTNDQYKQVFGNSVILGDSITEGLLAYNYLDESQVFCKIGASVINGDELFSQAAKTYPGFAFFAFGTNDMGNYNGNADNFIKKYRELITEFKKVSPDTIICINAISPPADNALAKNEILNNYKKFNSRIKKMCQDMKLVYIDNSYIIEDHTDFYAGDGIHVKSDYYPYWLNNMILKAGL